MTAAGIAAWGDLLERARVEAATRGTEHPVDLVAEDGDGVFAFVAWDAGTGEILRLYTHPRAWGRGAASERGASTSVMDGARTAPCACATGTARG